MDRSPFRANFRGMSGIPRFAAAWRRRRGGDGGVGFAVIDRNARSSQIEQYAKGQASDVRIFESIGRRSLTADDALARISEVLKVLGQRPGTKEALVFNGRGVIVASGDPADVGTHDTDPRILWAIDSGRPYAGHERDPGARPARLRVHRPGGDPLRPRAGSRPALRRASRGHT